MGTSEERLRILQMIEEGQLSPEDGVKLLQALNVNKSTPPPVPRPANEARWLRVRITEAGGGQVKVNLNIPMGLVRTGIKLGARFIPQDAVADFDYQGLVEAIESGEKGKIVELITDDDEQVEVWLE